MKKLLDSDEDEIDDQGKAYLESLQVIISEVMIIISLIKPLTIQKLREDRRYWHQYEE